MEQEILNQILNELKTLREGQARLEIDVKTIKESVGRIEESQPKDIMAMLDQMDKKLDIFKIDIDYLSEQQGKHDMQLNRINKLIQS